MFIAFSPNNLTITLIGIIPALCYGLYMYFKHSRAKSLALELSEFVERNKGVVKYENKAMPLLVEEFRIGSVRLEKTHSVFGSCIDAYYQKEDGSIGKIAHWSYKGWPDIKVEQLTFYSKELFKKSTFEGR